MTSTHLAGDSRVAKAAIAADYFRIRVPPHTNSAASVPWGLPHLPCGFSRWALASYCPFCFGSRLAPASAAHGLEPRRDLEPDKSAGFSFSLPSQNG